MYLQHHKSTDKAKTILFYALWVLYALSAATGIVEILQFCWKHASIETLYHLKIIKVTVFACCDSIAQFILIYRCWIVWGYSIRIVMVPSFLAFAFLAIWIATATAPLYIFQGKFYTADWGGTLEVAGLALSMTVNALVTGLIVFRIFKAFQQVQTRISEDEILGVTGSTLRLVNGVVFILIESGMALFAIQLARLVVTIVTTDAAYAAYYLILGIHEMLNGITPTIILMRVLMGLSFHDQSSMVEASVETLCCAPAASHSESNAIKWDCEREETRRF